MNKKIFPKLLFLFVLSFCASLQFCTNDSFAAVSYQSSIVNKAIDQGIYKCYTNGKVESSFDPIQGNYTSVGSLVKNDNSDENYVPLVTGLGSEFFWDSVNYNVADSGLSCSQLFEGGSYFLGGSNKGILAVRGHAAPSPSDANGVISFLQGMGYTVDSSGSSGKCYALTYSEEYYSETSTTESSGTTNSVCLTNGGLKAESNGGDATFSINQKGEICLNLPGIYASKGCYGNSNLSSFNGDWLVSSVIASCGSTNCVGAFPGGGSFSLTFSTPKNIGATGDLYNSSASITNGAGNAALQASNYLLDGETYKSESDLKITDAEKRILYQTYLEDYYGVKVDCSEDISDAVYNTKNIIWFDTGTKTKKICQANITSNNKKVNGVGGDGYFKYASDDINSIVAWLKNNDIDDAMLAQLAAVASEPKDTNGEDFTSNCKKNTSLGWIICPILQGLADAAASMYDDVVEPFLNFDSEFLDTNGNNNGVFAAWQIFQGFANIFLVIIILIIIFSQLTGVGIDNYGIKKMLPRLIVAAILINLSYFICQLAVDLSNILGYSLNGIFEGFTNTDAIQNSYTSESGAVATAATVGAGLATFAGATAAILSVGAIETGLALISLIPAMLAGLIAAVVAIFFFFILLGARNAGVILFVAIAPLAFALYILPNTKPLFDKWLKIFKALLLVYPIAGVLMGVGTFASALLMSVGNSSDKDGGFWMALVAMLVQVVPFFFIPTVLKSSFAALGNLGEKISGFGKRVGGSVGGGARQLTGNALKNSTGFNTARSEAARKRILGYNEKVANRLGGRSDLTTAQARRLAIARRAIEKDDDERVAARESTLKYSEDANNIDNLQQGLERAIKSNDTDGIRAYQNYLSGKGEDGRQAVHEAMAKAEKSGAVSNAARQTYASNIMNRWANDYKNNSRSTYDFANSNADKGTGKSLATCATSPSYAGSLKSNQMVSMDDKELNRLEKAINDPTTSGMSGESIQQVREAAAKALTDPNLQAGLKGNRREALERISDRNVSATATPASASQPSFAAAQPQATTDGTTLNVSHEPVSVPTQASTPAPTPTSNSTQPTQTSTQPTGSAQPTTNSGRTSYDPEHGVIHTTDSGLITGIGPRR